MGMQILPRGGGGLTVGPFLLALMLAEYEPEVLDPAMTEDCRRAKALMIEGQ